MTSLAITTALQGLDYRNEAATTVVNKYMQEHTRHDLISGLIGAAIPIPFAEFGAFAEQMFYQATAIYPPMSRELAVIYNAPLKSVHQFAAASFISESMLDFAVAEIGPEALGQLALELQDQLGVDFFTSIWTEILAEQGLSTSLSVVPFAGAAVSAVLDYFFARVMTKRVGTMISVYCQNGYEFVGNTKETYRQAKRLNPKRKSGKMNAGTLREARQIPELQQAQIETVKNMINPLKGKLGSAELRSYLKDQEIPTDVINKAMAESGLG